MPQLPAHLEEIRSRVFIEPSAPVHTSNIDDAHAFRAMRVDNSLHIDEFRSKLEIDVKTIQDDCIEFDVVGIDAPIANALRRILIAEIPTMAIEKVNLYNNTSIIQDEVLAHRLGLVPIYADPHAFEYVKEDEEETESNTLVFKLCIVCTENKSASANAAESDAYINSNVYSRELVWVPQGSQNELFKFDPPRPVQDDILIAVLRPGQVIEAELLVSKGIGQTHAKWSPVCTASYRLLPEIIVNDDVTDKLAKQLIKKCPKNVFDLEEIDGVLRASVTRPRDCSMCRECIRHPDWAERVKLRRVRNHFIFTVESVGQYSSEQLFTEALDILSSKCAKLLQCLDELTRTTQ